MSYFYTVSIHTIGGDDMNSTFIMTVFDFLDEEYRSSTIEGRLHVLLVCAKKRLDMKNHDNMDSLLLSNWNRWFHEFNIEEEDDGILLEKNRVTILHIIDILKLPPFQTQYLKHYLTEDTWNYTEMEKEIIIISGESFLLREKEVCTFLDSLTEN